MRIGTAALLGAVLALTNVGAPAAASAQEAFDRPVARLQSVANSGIEHGTAALIRRDDHGSETVLVLPDLIKPLQKGSRRAVAPAISLLPNDGQRLPVNAADVFMASAGAADIAVFRVTAPAATALVAQRLVYDAPHAGAAFFVSGYDAAGSPARVAAHVGYRSTLLAIGDRDVSSLSGCLGAPAVVGGGDGIFGVISDCQPQRCPVITLLSVARRFIERYVPPRPAVAGGSTTSLLR